MTTVSASTDMRFTGMTTKFRMADIVHMIDAAPHGMTFDQIAQLAGMHERTLQMYVAHMHKDAHLIHIGGWILLKDGKAVKVFKTGNRPDALRPSIHADDACFLHQHPLHVSRLLADDEVLPVRRIFSKWVNGEWLAA